MSETTYDRMRKSMGTVSGLGWAEDLCLAFLCQQFDSLRAEVAALKAKGGDASEGGLLETTVSGDREHQQSSASPDVASPPVGTARGDDNPECNFCGKRRREVAKIIHGNGTHICNECVGLCVEILDEEKIHDASPAIALLRQYQAAVKRWGESKDPADYAVVQRIQGELSAVRIP